MWAYSGPFQSRGVNTAADLADSVDTVIAVSGEGFLAQEPRVPVHDGGKSEMISPLRGNDPSNVRGNASARSISRLSIA